MSEPVTPTPAPRLRRIEIRNYKALDALDLDFPPPLMAGDPDIFVVGSANGVGKTSLLECCALAHLVRHDPDLLQDMLGSEEFHDDWAHLVRAGQAGTQITPRFGADAKKQFLELSSTGRHRISPPPVDEEDHVRPPHLRDTLRSFFSHSANPLILPHLLLFHSFRKIQEGPIPTSALLAGESGLDEHREPISIVKRVILSTMMGRASLIENISADDAAVRFEKFDELLATFAGCRLARLRNAPGGDFELRVGSSQGLNFTFDGLSSGQKEILSTLFLIWEVTRNRPGLVLIDEPELHLNAEWHREFVRHLHKLAPHNQYILATHSEHIFASVDRDRRLLLTSTPE